MCLNAGRSAPICCCSGDADQGEDGLHQSGAWRIQLQLAYLAARPDWWIVSQVAQRMGYAEAFAYRSAADVFREHAALSAFENGGTRDFDIGGLATISDAEFEALEPVQ